MLWSLIKILAFVAAVMALTWGAILLLEVPASATMTAGGYEISLSALQLVIAAIVLVALIWLAFKLIGLLVATFKFLNGDETAISRYFSRNRERRGYDALADGMMALASGDGQLAMIKADRANRYLERPELTNLLAAQAAEMAGDKRKAEQTYKALLSDERTRFVGVRGLMKQKLAEGDTETALKLAEKAFTLRPKNTEVSDTLLRLQADEEDWSGARTTLASKLRNGTMPRDVHKRRDAVLALSEARDQMADGKEDKARDGAIEANRLSPELIPAAIMAARAHIARNSPRSAARVLKKAWATKPHPDLAAAFAEIRPDEKPDARLKRFRELTGANSGHAESRMLMAELNVAAEHFPEARRALGDLVETDPTARVLTLMAAIERGEGKDDSVVRGWLTRALNAPRGPQWICDNCHNITRDWAPVCPNCHSFDTLTWTRPPESEVAMPRGTEMLPLIVGALDKKAETDDEAPVEAEVVDETPAPGAEETQGPSEEAQK
ncbi:heme biosynthesis protein HemY [Histidinibacterium aquaticum]|uniref:Tetratricopeptide repeat protein n=1 Tax=Histidinibacterium aquaticum TaxID=2613962 RepID=A0A5J5GHC7_9RHOB|nr:heme biosynthesis HemY N-terminal domain-containing protein [Histidinibacterium aquaticum]KAA9007142.1 tetratricopeptide repeat protein [Histidinibacterium aquaticum]